MKSVFFDLEKRFVENMYTWKSTTPGNAFRIYRIAHKNLGYYNVTYRTLASQLLITQSVISAIIEKLNGGSL